MAREDTSSPSAAGIRLEPLGQLGLDLRSTREGLNPLASRRLEHVRTDERTIRRRDGSRNVAAVADATKSLTLGSDAIYGVVNGASKLLIPAGGFAVFFSFTAAYAAGSLGYLWANRIDGQTYGVLWATISSAGVLTVSWRAESGSTISCSSSAFADDQEVHGLAVFDAVSGTFTLYIEGEQVDQVTGISSTERPIQEMPLWHWGVEWNPATVAVTANTHFDGAQDGFCLLALRGQRIAEGDPSPLYQLRRFVWQQYPNPADPRVLLAFDFDEASGAVVNDRSRDPAHMTLVGAATRTSPLVYRATPSALIHTWEKPSTSRVNLWGAGGRLYYETVRGA